MKRIAAGVAAFTILALAAGCSSHQPVQTFRVPPRIDLTAHEVIGVLEFTATARGGLGPLATRRFMEAARSDQTLVRIVEVGPPSQALASVERGQWDAGAYQAVGRKQGVRTLFTGALTVSSVKPAFQVSAMLRSGEVTAHVDATLEVQMIETATGASLWSRSARATRNVGHVSVFGGGAFSFDAQDPEEAYGDLVDFLVNQVTSDFRATWERR